MKITIVTGPSFPVPPVRGGSVPRMWFELAKEFARNRHEVVLLPRRFPGQPRQELIEGLTVKRIGGFDQSRSLFWDLTRDFAYAATVTRRLPTADILVTNDFWLPVLAPRFRTDAGSLVISANRFPKGQYRLYRRAARIVAPSSAVADSIRQQMGAVAEKVTCIPNAINTSVFTPAASESHRPNRTILYVGRVHPEKGVHILVRAFAQVARRVADVKLCIVGPVRREEGGGGERYTENLRALATGLPVTFTESEFEPGRLAQIYKDADLFCYPSIAEKGEAFGVAPLEAMSSGVPVIVSALACFTDFVDDGKTGLVFDHRLSEPSAALENVMHSALTNWSETREIAKRGREVARQFSFQHVAERFLAEFENLLRANR